MKKLLILIAVLSITAYSKGKKEEQENKKPEKKYLEYRIREYTFRIIGQERWKYRNFFKK